MARRLVVTDVYDDEEVEEKLISCGVVESEEAIEVSDYSDFLYSIKDIVLKLYSDNVVHVAMSDREMAAHLRSRGYIVLGGKEDGGDIDPR